MVRSERARPPSSPTSSTGRVAVLGLVAALGFGLMSVPIAPPRVAAVGDPVIAAAGDIACDPANSSFNSGNGSSSNCHMKNTAALLTPGLAAVLPLGDNQYYCGSLAAFLGSYDKSWGAVKAITRPAVGNHEYLTSGGTGCDSTNGGAAGHFAYFGAAAGAPGSGYYSYDVGAWHLIALNTNCGDAGGCSASTPQGKWLAADLAAHRNVCTLAYMHIPLFSSGGRANSNSRSFWDQLYAAGADVVLTGHDHTYERFARQSPAGVADPVKGIREFVVGTGGANHTSFTSTAANSEVRNASTYGVLRMTLHATSYDWQFAPEAGATFTDAGSEVCVGGGSGGGNTPPTANPASLTATTALQAAWTPSVSDPDAADTLTCAIVTPPANGTAAVNANCSGGTYTSDAAFTGSDPFSYKVNDGHVDSAAASVTVTVSGGGGSIALVHQTPGSGSAATVAVPLAPASVTGHALVALVALAAGSSASVLSVTDSASGTWTKGPVGFVTGSNSRVEIWYRLNASSVTSVTVTLSAAKAAAVNVTEWSGVAAAVDASKSGSGASATTLTTPSSFTTTNPTDVLIGAVNYPAAVSSTLAAGSFTGLSDFSYASSVHGRAAYQITSATGSFQASWTLSGLSGSYGSAILALKAA